MGDNAAYTNHANFLRDAPGGNLEIPSTIPYFCEPSEKCGLEVALERVRTSYTMVGLTEEMELTTSSSFIVR